MELEGVVGIHVISVLAPSIFHRNLRKSDYY